VIKTIAIPAPIIRISMPPSGLGVGVPVGVGVGLGV